MNKGKYDFKNTARYIIREDYFGRFDQVRAICYCQNIHDVKLIIDALVLSHKGRPFIYKAEKIAEEYDELHDELISSDPFTGEVTDLSCYLKGMSCLK